MARKGRKNYWDSFKPKRVPRGQAISRVEMTRRLAHYLQIPQRFGYRLMLAFENVIQDALRHGEGIKFANAGTLSLEHYDTDTVRVLNKMVPRKRMYKYQWKVSKAALRFIDKISQLEKDGLLDDYFRDPEDN